MNSALASAFGPLALLVSDGDAPYQSVNLASHMEDAMSPLHTLAMNFPPSQWEGISTQQIQFRTIKFITQTWYMVTAEGVVFNTALTGAANLFEVATLDNNEDKADYYYALGLLFLRLDGSVLLETYGRLVAGQAEPPTQVEVPYNFIKCQREFGLIQNGNLIHFTDQTSTPGSAPGGGELIIDFAVTGSADQERALVLVSGSGTVNITTCQILNGQMIVDRVVPLPYSNIWAVYSHWNINYIILLDRNGDVIVHDLASGAAVPALAISGHQIIELSQPGCFPLSLANYQEKNGKVLAAAYGAQTAFVLRNYDTPRWEPVGRFKSLAGDPLTSSKYLYGIPY